MLTYDLERMDGPIYESIYKCMKEDILSGILKPGEKLPSKRTFADNHGISTITIQNAYDQLISEGYVTTIPKRGYYVAKIEGMSARAPKTGIVSYDIEIPGEQEWEVDFSGNTCSADYFPFSIWTKLSREVMSTKKDELMKSAPVCGIPELREAIADHLRSYRGMMVDPNQIIVGAGTEYLYGLLTELLGTQKRYVIENPGYMKLVKIYRQRGIECGFASLDENGVTVEALEKAKAEVAHICPNHHFPTGITMPASRRYEILSWANETGSRFIIEDDYDSEFRTEGKPIPTLFSIDACEKVIYMNTFSKSLSPTIRISYMVLPVPLVKQFYEKLAFYSCTVSNFEQYTLAMFIKAGYFEKHINRMRLFYMRKRKQVLELTQKCGLGPYCDIIENDSGLHFLIKLKTDRSEAAIRTYLSDRGIHISSLADFDARKGETEEHLFLMNYSNMETQKWEKALFSLKELLES